LLAGKFPQAGRCPLPSLLKYGSCHSSLATGVEKLPFNFHFWIFVLAGSYAAVAAIDPRMFFEFTRR